MITRVLLPIILTTFVTNVISSYIIGSASQPKKTIVAPKNAKTVEKPGIVQPKWRIFTPPDGRFSVLMPGIPQRKTQLQKTSIGEIDLTIFSVQPPKQEAAYLVTYNDFPYDYVQMSNPQKIFDQAQYLALKTTRSNLVSQRNIRSSNGHPGKEIKYIDAVGKLTINRMYIADGRLYQVIAVTSKKQRQTLSKTIIGYLDSFHLVLKR